MFGFHPCVIFVLITRGNAASSHFPPRLPDHDYDYDYDYRFAEYEYEYDYLLTKHEQETNQRFNNIFSTPKPPS